MNPGAVADRAELRTVAETAARIGVSPRTLRYYEELGFLAPARTSGGHRLYGRAEVETVERIRRMQSLGLSLTTIRKVLRYRSYQDETGRRRLAAADLRQITEEARADANAVRDRVAELRRELGEATREAEHLERDVAFLEQRLAERTAEEEADGDRR